MCCVEDTGLKKRKMIRRSASINELLNPLLTTNRLVQLYWAGMYQALLKIAECDVSWLHARRACEQQSAVHAKQGGRGTTAES